MSLPSAGPRKMPIQARSRRMVEAILDAAADVLTERGHAATSTNLVAERAGVSVGSLYQYFPNKAALIAALHARHSRQMAQVIAGVLSGATRGSLRHQIEALVRALIAAHLVEPRLHQVLERERPFFEGPDTPPAPPTPTSPDVAAPPDTDHDHDADHDVFLRVHQLLERHREEIQPRDLKLATWVIQRIVETLVHAAVIEPPAGFSVQALERAIVDAVMGYLGSR